jgi:SAM-dependent methyltransferase
MDANPMHEANRRGWDAVSPSWQAMIDQRYDWRGCPKDPTIALDSRELELLGELEGRDVCVLGSGDNLVVFAMAGMGAGVTSVDISQPQLDTAAARAKELGLDISFVRADVVDLSPLGDERFDLVYTGGHVAVWVSALESYYSEACRILRRGGTFMVNEYHPFRRVWRDSLDELAVAHSYFERGPHQYYRSESVPGMPAGSLPSYEFNWTVADYVSAVMEAGCDLLAIDEIGDGVERWEGAPMSGLPNYLLLVGRKR